MLRKVLKHEFISSVKILGIVYVASMMLSGFSGLMSAVSGSSYSPFTGILMWLSMLGMYAIVISTAVILFGRYNNAILGKEAYFTFTLPVKNYVHIVARMINAAIFILMAVAVVFVNVMFFSGMNTFNLFRNLGGEGVSILFFILLTVFVLTFTGVMEVYAAMSLGTLFTKNRVGGMLLSMFIFSAVGITISVPLSMPFFEMLGSLFNLIFRGGGSYSSGIWVLFGLLTAVCAVLSGIFYLIIWYISCKRLKVGDN